MMQTHVSSAFSKTFKLLALTIVAFIARSFWQVYSNGSFVGNGQTNASNGLIWALLGFALLLYTLWSIYRSTTTLTDETLTQTWIWNKSVKRSEIAYAKLIRVKGLEWLIAPRLYVKTLGKFHAFYACEPKMLAQFEAIAQSFALPSHA